MVGIRNSPYLWLNLHKEGEIIMLSDTVGNDTVDCINTASGYQIRLNGIEIGFISYLESRAESKAESFQWAAMQTLIEKQRQEKESGNV